MALVETLNLASELEKRWGKTAPLGWGARDEKCHEAVARGAVALLSDWFPYTTGEMVHVDGGYHAVGAAPIEVQREMSQAESGEANR